jgi:hypothetical protein
MSLAKGGSNAFGFADQFTIYSEENTNLAIFTMYYFPELNHRRMINN